MKQFPFLNQTPALQQPLIMGILNVTPDSFSDGGKFYDGAAVNVSKVVEAARQMVHDGANILDIGGESSGPGSKDVTLEEELQRVLPVVESITNYKLRIINDGVAAQPFLISVDTWKAEVARKALQVGADMINDVTALRGDVEMVKVLAEFQAPVVLMYSKDPTARTTRHEIHYEDVMKTIADFFEERIEFAIKAGIKRERLILDPGMGAFISMDPKYSLQILKRLKELKKFGLPILVGASRKGFVGEITNYELRITKDGGAESFKPLPASERLEGSLACAAIATWNGASILRVHDVKESRRVVDMVAAIMKS